MRDRDYASGGYGQQGYNRTMSGDYGREDYGRQGYGGYAGQDWTQGRGGYGAFGDEDWNRGQGYQGQGYQGYGGYRGQPYQGQNYGRGQGFASGRYGGQGYQGQGYQGQGYGQRYGRGGYGADTGYYDVYAIWWTPGEHTGSGPKGYQRSDDRIREDISERLQQSGQIDAHEIEVGVSNGIVTLKGSVPDRQMKRMAEDAVDSCSGVKDVHNELRVEDHGHDQNGQSTGSQMAGSSRSRQTS